MNSLVPRRFGIVLMLAFLIFGRSAVAQHMNAADAPCRNAGTDAVVARCFLAESQTADRDLNAIYARVRAVLGPEDQAKLRDAQRLWLQFRDANCAAERGLYTSGSTAPTVYYACMAADTHHRVAELNTMYGWVLQK